MGSGMKVDRYSALEEWLQMAMQVLLIKDWEIVVSRDAADIDAHADIEVSSQKNYADLRVQRDFFDQTPEKQRLILVHELGHVINARADQVFESLAKPLGEIAWAVLEPNYLDATERAVEHWANIVAPNLPLPVFPKK